MTISDVSTNVQALLANMDNFVSVISHPPTEKSNFDGYPAAAHYYTDTQSDYATVSQNRRVLDYVVELYLVSSSDTSDATEFTEMYTLIDDVLNMFDRSRDLSDSSLSLARACDIMKPTPGALNRIETDAGTGLMCTLHLYPEADVTFIS